MARNILDYNCRKVIFGELVVNKHTRRSSILTWNDVRAFPIGIDALYKVELKTRSCM